MELLKQAIDLMSARCDGAATLDGQGFNKLDAPLGHKLAHLPQKDWTVRQTRAAWRMLGKYRGQLSDLGIDYNEIPEPPQITKEDKAPCRLVISDKGNFQFLFPYDASLVSAVKQLPDRHFDGDSKSWIVRAKLENVEPVIKFALKYDFEYADKVVQKIEELATVLEERIANVEASRAADAEIAVEGLGGELRPFQKAGVAYAMKQKRTFIADEMGLGKTIEALATIQATNAYPAVIVCPASLKLNWQREAEKWLPGHMVNVWNGKAENNLPADIVIINYDVLKKNLEALKALGPQAVVFDESHYAKNYKAQRTEACKELAKGVPIRLALTGTPVLNRPQELLSQLGIIGRLDDVGGFWTFAKRYCLAHQTRFGWDFSGAAHLDELNEKMRMTCFIRRNKADVLKELPAKQRTILSVSLDNRAEYYRAETQLISWLKERAAADREFLASIAHLSEEEQQKAKSERAASTAERALRAEQLVRIEALKQLAAKGKMAAIVEWVESFLETGEKLILFAHHQNVIDELAAKFEARTITGQTSIEARQAAVDAFQNDPNTRLIICNIKAGGVGLTLTAASNVAFCELEWTPAAHDQAEDRAHRVGQQNSVNAWYLLADNTIDTEIYRLIEAKRQIVNAATEGTESNEDISILKNLISNLTKGDK